LGASESLQISSHSCSGAGKHQAYLPFDNELMWPERLINGKGEYSRFHHFLRCML